jgi:hypothetical protein
MDLVTIEARCDPWKVRDLTRFNPVRFFSFDGPSLCGIAYIQLIWQPVHPITHVARKG